MANQHFYDDAVDMIDDAKKEGLGYFYDAVEEIIDKHRRHHLNEGMAAVRSKLADGLQKARQHLEQAKRFTPQHEAVTKLAQAINQSEADLERQKKMTAGEYLQKGEEHRNAKPPDFERALMYYNLALEIDENHREALNLRTILKRTLENKGECLEMVASAETDHAVGDVPKAIETLREAIRKASLIGSWKPENADELLAQYETEYVEDAEAQIQSDYNACKFADALEQATAGSELFRIHSTAQRKHFQNWIANIEAAREEMEKLCKQVREAIEQADFATARRILRDLNEGYPGNPHTDEFEADIEEEESSRESKILTSGYLATGRSKLDKNLYSEAIAAFDEALAIVFDHAEATRWKSVAERRASELKKSYANAKGLFERKQYRLAKPSLELLIRDEPDIRAEASKLLADTNAILSKSEEQYATLKGEEDARVALRLADEILSVDPHHPEIPALRPAIERQAQAANAYERGIEAEDVGNLRLAVEELRSGRDGERPLHGEGLACFRGRPEINEAVVRVETALNTQAAELLEAIKAEPNPQTAWSKLNDELLREVYPDYPPALEYRPILETLVKAYEGYQRGLDYEKQDATLRAALNEYTQSLDFLRGLTIDVSHLDINETVLESRMDSVRSRLRAFLLEQANQAMTDEQYESAERLAREGEREFREEPRFAEILREIKVKRQQVKTLLFQATSHIQLRERAEKEESDIEEAREAVATAETLLSRVVALDAKDAEAVRLLEGCRDWNSATAEIAQAEGLHNNGETDRAREVIAHVLTRFPNRADARKLSESLDSVTPIFGTIRFYVQEQPTDFIVLPPDREISIGSTSGNAIKLTGNLSRKQAQIIRNGSDYTLKHLSTSYPTTINGETVKDSALLRDGDEIGLGGKPRLQFNAPPTGDSANLEPIEDGLGISAVIYVLMNKSATLGAYRKHNATIGLGDNSLANPHARLLYEDGCYWLEPIAPTEHDEQPCHEKTKLHHGSRITLGETEIRIEEKSPCRLG